MNHIRSISRPAPKSAQFESLLQLVGLLGSILSLLDQWNLFLIDRGKRPAPEE